MRIIYYFCILCFLPLSSFADFASEKVEQLLEESFQKFREVDFGSSIALADSALSIATESNYATGSNKANIYLAKAFVELGLHEKALQHIEAAQAGKNFHQELKMNVEAARLKGRIYTHLMLYDAALKEFREQLRLSRKIEDIDINNLATLWAYQNIAFLFKTVGQIDSLELYLKKQVKQLHLLDEQKYYYEYITNYAEMGDFFAEIDKLDLAEQHLYESMRLINKYNISYRYFTLQRLGDLEQKRKHAKKALTLYEEALQNSLELGANIASRDLYGKISNLLSASNLQPEKAYNFLQRYQHLNDSLENINRKAITVVIENLKNSHERRNNEQRMQVRTTSTAVAAIILISAAFFYHKYKTKKKKLLESKEIIEEREKEHDQLRQHLEYNRSQEIIQMAKDNDPGFLTLFAELHPEFVQALKKVNPSVKNRELQFCAMAYLNFSTKDIARHTFVSIRAVQIRKNRLRKKYGISSEQDFNEWFINLDKSN